jgi:bifunctional pyridoxal-dependent enzyme with beta-cystathionase and maltose regulon repressor activities
MEEVARLAKKHNLIVLSDEVYEWMTYDDATHIRMASLPGMWERTITLGAPSTAHAHARPHTHDSRWALWVATQEAPGSRSR